MTTTDTGIHRAARALALRDDLDYFERANHAGIADLTGVAALVVAAAREAGGGLPDADLASDPVSVGAAARTLAQLESDIAFAVGNAEAMTRHLDDARAMLAALPQPSPVLAAA
ncbi:hypothetical protein CHO01_22860 [Cellulomonas hominis]|uniref:Uncharacterized protein n=1 Tax=Cellulomonas hominis TaxID=156981 RepID=A0A511FD49_9CELL|nr:hypothetical protein [Cellulomonas hominis]MBB5474616.1 hypothetical protein [Cellulomonas hominis]NKY05489.1 hypothetical protein [Cellulomonas hominis]GEL47170.1 hypothetical protein CHO01_22860 [Cellulomonas hominis]